MYLFEMEILFTLMHVERKSNRLLNWGSDPMKATWYGNRQSHLSISLYQPRPVLTYSYTFIIYSSFPLGNYHMLLLTRSLAWSHSHHHSFITLSLPVCACLIFISFHFPHPYKSRNPFLCDCDSNIIIEPIIFFSA